MTVEEMAALGGRARHDKLTKVRRSEIAKQAAAARWKDHIKKPRRPRNKITPPT
jgi:hypothetical protein